MAKQVLTTGKFVYNSVTYGVTNLSLDKNLSEVDMTDTDTTGNEKEYLAGRQERPLTVEMWKDVNQADPPLGEVYAGSLDFEGFTYSGNIILLSIKNSAAIDDGVKMTVEGRFTGAVTETPAT